MEAEYSLSPAQYAGALAQREQCNALAARCGLELSVPQFLALEEHRLQALREAGRIEFGAGVLPELVHAFCDSPYLGQREWPAALAALTELFYHFKNECGGALSDGELIAVMQASFNGPAHGSLEYLAGTALEALCRLLRIGEEDPDGRFEPL